MPTSNWTDATMTRLRADIVREDGRLERSCKHGVGHPVGHMKSRMLRDESMWAHHCCETDGRSCCADWINDRSHGEPA